MYVIKCPDCGQKMESEDLTDPRVCPMCGLVAAIKAYQALWYPPPIIKAQHLRGIEDWCIETLYWILNQTIVENGALRWESVVSNSL